MTAEETMQWYLNHGANELRKISDQILKGKFSGAWKRLNLAQKDEDDFYSIANMVLWDVSQKWDGKRDFQGLLWRSLYHRFASEFRKRGQQKREGDRELMSLDFVMSDEGGTLEDVVDSGFSIEREIQKNGIDRQFSSKGVIKYIDGLSAKQKELLTLRMYGYSQAEIKKKMNLTDKKYQRLNSSLREYEHVSKLYSCKRPAKIQRKDNEEMKRCENSKVGIKEIRTLCEMLDDEELRCDHPMQRPSGQWTTLTKSEFISDLLQGNAMLPIVISEEIRDDRTIFWIIDGCQRCTTVNEFIHDGFKISGSVQISDIDYETDEIVKRDRDGSPIRKVEQFNIKNKKFSQLPDALQKVLLKFEYPTLLNLRCSKEKIAYDIARLNRSRPMNSAQTGWTGLDEGMAVTIKNMIRNMDFFSPDSDINAFKPSDAKNGQIQKMIVETMMMINFPDDYTTDFKKNCRFLARHAGDWTTTNLYSLVADLQEILESDVADLFTTTKTALWLTLFNRFKDIEIDGARLSNHRFVDFLREFKERLYAREVNGESLDSIGTADSHRKSKLQRKMNVLLHLMWEYFGVIPQDEEDLHNEPVEETQEIEEENTVTETVIAEQENNFESGEEQSEVVESFEESPKEPIDIKKFCSDILHKEVLDEDIELFKDVLHDDTKNIDPDVPLLEDDNMPSLIAMVAWSCQEEKDRTLEKWLPAYIKKTNEYKRNQAENFKDMRVDFMIFEATNMREEAS